MSHPIITAHGGHKYTVTSSLGTTHYNLDGIRIVPDHSILDTDEDFTPEEYAYGDECPTHALALAEYILRTKN